MSPSPSHGPARPPPPSPPPFRVGRVRVPPPCVPFQFRSDRDKRTTICGDQQHGQCNACCKEGQCYGAGEAVVAVNHGNGDQGAESLKQNPTHFTVPKADSLITMRWRLASSAVWSAFTISGCVARWLSSAGFRASVSCSSSIRAVGKVGEGRSLLRHLGPFFVHGVLYVTVDLSINTRSLSVGESSGE